MLLTLQIRLDMILFSCLCDTARSFAISYVRQLGGLCQEN